MDTRGFSACHTPHTTPRTHHNTTQNNNTTTTPHGDRETEIDRDRQRQKEDSYRERREKTEEERQDKRRREDSFPVWSFFVGVVIFCLIPFAHAPWQVNSFEYLRIIYSVQSQVSVFF